METSGQERVLVLVKAVPHATAKGETVCCAGITESGQWRRQFPIRFRLLRDNKFGRWDWITYRWVKPKGDDRKESRRVREETIEPDGTLPPKERAALLNPLVVGSVAAAQDAGQSLALIRPIEPRFIIERKTAAQILAEKQEYERVAAQRSLFDEELAALDPCPYSFRFKYRTEAGEHENACEDWETAAMFWRLRKSYGENAALHRIKTTFGEQYPQKGMAFAMGTHSRFRTTWLLIGVIRLDLSPEGPQQLSLI